MSTTTDRPAATRRTLAALATLVLLCLGIGVALPAWASGTRYVAIVGSGSTWSANMVEQWAADIESSGISVSFSAVGSSTGRREFSAGTVDFAVSEIPYGLRDAQGGVEPPPSRGFAYLPIVAGGTSFMYNLTIGGQRVTNLRLSGAVLTGIFTGTITNWSDPAISADNPQLALPDRRIIPVVRSDGSGTSAQFTQWMATQHTGAWNAFCSAQGIAYSGNCSFTSNYPAGSGFISQSGSLGVAGYVATPTAEGAITYVEYSYALNAQFPVVKVLNGAGVYVEPTAEAVAVGLLQARINNDAGNRDTYLTQILDGVYDNADTRAYPLSSYSYMVIPTAEGGTFSEDKGRSLGDWLYYSICEGQQSADVLGYSPLPQNLVQAGLEQVRLIPGVDVQNVDVSRCNNPTFSPDGRNVLAETAPQPPDCDRQGPVQCAEGTGGARGTATAASAGGAAAPGDAAAGGGGAGGDPAAGAGAGSTGGDPAAGGAAATTPGAVAPGAAAPVVDPETGELLSAGATGIGGTSLVSGVPVAAPGGTGAVSQVWLMVLAGAAVLAATLGPAVVNERLVQRRKRS